MDLCAWPDLLLVGMAAGVWLSPMSRESTAVGFTDQDGRRIAYVLVEGGHARSPASLPVVFIHGAGSDRRMWHHQLSGSCCRGPRIAIDLLGHGESDKPEDAAYGFTTWARNVDAVLSHLEIDRAVLVGHSNGVPVVREFYRLFPEKTLGMVLSDGPFQGPIAESVAGWMRAAMARSDFEEHQRRLVDQTPRGSLSHEDLALVKEAALATPRHVMAAHLDALTDPAGWHDDPIGVPVLMIVSQGRQPDRNVADRALAESLIEDLDYQVWEGVTHFFPLEKAAEFDDRLKVFLSRLQGRRR